MNQTRIKTIFHFHELSLPVIEHEGGEFVPVKPIIEHIGMNWRTALRTLQTDFRTKFFHFQHLNVPLPSGLGGSCATQTPVILLQKVHFYIAQLNPEMVQAKGNSAAADYLIQLHEEWADALYSYETTGIAVKKGHQSRLKEMMQLRKSAIGEEIHVFNKMIAAELALYYEQLDSPQQALPLQQAI